VISLIIAFRNKKAGVQVTGLEFQSDLAMLTQDNILANNLDSNLSVVEGDLRRIGESISPESFDLVVCNPPYRQPDSGRVSPTDQRARARHEIDATLEDIVHAAAFAVKNRGRFVVVYPAQRAMSLIHCLKNKNLEPKRLQPVYSYPESNDASLVLVEAIKNGGEEVQILAPFYIYSEKNGPYTEQMQELYN
jgi:tRNA1(Val) A37 N6-methylase TrmN6